MEKDILIITNIYPDINNPYKGTFVYDSYLLLVENKFQTDVVAPKNLKKASILTKIQVYLEFLRSTFVKLNETDYKIIYFHYANHSLIPYILFKPLFKNKKIVINAHGGDIIPFGMMNRLLSLITIKQLAHADYLIFPSRFLKSVYFENSKYSGSTLVYPSGGVNTNLLKPMEVMNCESRSLTIAFFGRIEEGKGWDVFVTTIKIIAEKGVYFQAIVGGYGQEIGRMKKLVDKYELNNYFNFVGAQSRERLSTFFSKIDLMLFPTKRLESLGLVALESMACGVPVIGPTLGAIPEYIQDGKNGFLVNSNKPEEYSTKIIEYYNLTCDQKRELSVNARQTAKKYDCYEIKDEFIQVFQKLNS